MQALVECSSQAVTQIDYCEAKLFTVRYGLLLARSPMAKEIRWNVCLLKRTMGARSAPTAVETLSNVKILLERNGYFRKLERKCVQFQSSSVAQAARELEHRNCCCIGCCSTAHFAAAVISFAKRPRVTVSLRRNDQCLV